MITVIFNQGLSDEFTMQVDWFEEIYQTFKLDDSERLNLTLNCFNFPQGKNTMIDICRPLFQDYTIQTIDCYPDDINSEPIHFIYYDHIISCSTLMGSPEQLKTAINKDFNFDDWNYKKIGILKLGQSR